MKGSEKVEKSSEQPDDYTIFILSTAYNEKHKSSVVIPHPSEGAGLSVLFFCFCFVFCFFCLVIKYG